MVIGTWLLASYAAAMAEFDGRPPVPVLTIGFVANICGAVVLLLAAVVLARTPRKLALGAALLLWAAAALEVAWVVLLVAGWIDGLPPLENLLWDAVQIAASLGVAAFLVTSVVSARKSEVLAP